MKAFFSIPKRPHMAMMIVCVAAMAAAYMLFIESSGYSVGFGFLAALVACLGVHFLLHRGMGRGNQPASNEIRLLEQKSDNADLNGSAVRDGRIGDGNAGQS